MRKIILTFATLLLLTQSASAQQNCYALTLQGASDQGAFQAGALYYLINNAPVPTNYEVITGVSVGAFTTGIFGQYPIGQEKAAVDEILNTWKAFDNSKLYKNWLAGPAYGLVFEKGMYNTKNMPGYIASVMPNSPVRPIAVGATNANDATYWSFNNFESPLSAQDLQTGVFGSMATPGVFPYVNYEGATLIEGSTLKNLDISTAVEYCRNLNGKNDEAIYVDVIMTTNKDWAELNVTSYTSLQMLFLTLKITNFRATQYDLQKAQWDYPNVNFRYIVFPTASLPSTLYPFDYSSSQIQQMISQGEADAKAAIAAGAGAGWKELTETANTYIETTFGAMASLPDPVQHAQMIEKIKQILTEEEEMREEMIQSQFHQ